MKVILLLVLGLLSSFISSAQQIQFPDSLQWNNLKEGTTISFQVSTNDSTSPKFSLFGINGYGIQFDSLGNFLWTPSYDLVDRLEEQKEINLIFQAEWSDGRKVRTTKNMVVFHQNRLPQIEDLPVFYVRQSVYNRYQISLDYITDPDGDPIVFKAIPSQLPEGAVLSPAGILGWTPSRNQFASLKNNPLIVEFIIQDQPSKAESKGQIKIAQTQLDLPPEVLIVPGDSLLTVKEDSRVNLKIYFSDPNGDEHILSSGFLSSDERVPKSALKENSLLQSEFTWTPGYTFVQEVEKEKIVELIFFVLDRSSNRTQRKVKVKVLDAENLDEKDKLIFLKYRQSLVQAKALIDLLEDNHAALSKSYKQAKRGKKHRAIVNASLGATTGLSPVVLATDDSKVVSAIGGTTVLTMGTLEATEVIGKSKNDILDKLKINVEIRNQLQVEGDNFARKYALKSARRNKEFDIDREKLLPILNNQKLVMLELDASRNAQPKFTDGVLKKTFPDFSEQQN